MKTNIKKVKSGWRVFLQVFFVFLMFFSFCQLKLFLWYTLTRLLVGNKVSFLVFHEYIHFNLPRLIVFALFLHRSHCIVHHHFDSVMVSFYHRRHFHLLIDLFIVARLHFVLVVLATKFFYYHWKCWLHHYNCHHHRSLDDIMLHCQSFSNHVFVTANRFGYLE